MAVFLISGNIHNPERLGRRISEAGHRAIMAPKQEATEEFLAGHEIDLLIVGLTGYSVSDLGTVSRLVDLAKPADALVVCPPKIEGDQSSTSRQALISFIGLSSDRIIEADSSLGHIMAVSEAIMARSRLVKARDYLRHSQGLIYRTGDLVAHSSIMKNVIEQAKLAAESNLPVLFTGEPGTGKGLLAGLIHFNSDRASQPFVEVNCVSISGEILDSEVFGHISGSTPTAISDRAGRLEQAEGGSILFDSIHLVPPTIQARLYRVLTDYTYQRLGSSRIKECDVRIMAATPVSLFDEAAGGDFDRELANRLNAISISVPSLRERGQDIFLLAQHFLDRACRRLGRSPLSMERDAIKIIGEQSWPGNIRELAICMERAAMAAEGESIYAADLALSGNEIDWHSQVKTFGEEDHRFNLTGLTLDEAERLLVHDALERTGWVQRQAAELLGISRRALNYKVTKLGLTHADWTVNRPEEK